MSTRVNTIFPLGSIFPSPTIRSRCDQLEAAFSLLRCCLTWLLERFWLRAFVFATIVLWPWQSAW